MRDRELIRGIKEAKTMASPKRGDYVHADKIGAAVSGHFGYQNLRGFWPLSNLDENFNAYDITGQGRTLTATDVSSGLYNNKIPYAEYNGSSSKHLRTSEAGLEIATDITVGCWFCADNVSNRWLIGKGDDWSLYIGGDGKITFRARDSGATDYIADYDTTLQTGQWYNAVGRATSGGTIDIFLQGVLRESNSMGADINVSGSDFSLGYISASFGEFFFDGKIAWAFVAAAAASDTQIRQHYDAAKTAFKVYE